MSDPAFSPSSVSRWLLPALAAFTVLGVLAFGLWSGPDQQRPPAVQKEAPLAQATPANPAPAPEVAGPSTPLTAKAQAPATGATTPVAPAPTVVAPAVGGAPLQPALAADAGPLTDPLAEQALSPGEPATARVTVGGRSTPQLSPNQIGAFPRVYLPLGGQADVQLQLPEAEPGDQVVAAVTDGGRFADGQPVQAFTLDESRRIDFQFKASQSLGNFRVTVRHGAQTKVVTFWAGDRALAFNH